MEDSKFHSQGLFYDIDNHIRSIQSESLAGFSAFLGEVSDPALSEAARVEKLANYYEGEYRRFAEKARVTAEHAEAVGDSPRASVWRAATEEARGWADQRASTADAHWIQSTHHAIGARVSSVLGPIGNLVDATKILTDAARGDWRELSANTSSVLLGVGLAKVGAVVAGAAFAPALAPAIAAAGGAALGT
ncbi:hypothetical protein [Thioalkalivibrio sp. ALJ24]|uniref:hypothetical protein n=1 Tax=Thioalkalivibrio sp. ALJ24 TaxID=545276 RepID=UPI0012E9BF5C|nr:hypothetical protein [Thioalkalivibrio sp. ALJ24]